jgi:hypothetical protein
MTKLFIQKAIEVHGDKYDYSKTEYVRSSQKVIIICKEHGEFLQIPNNHLRGAECKLCSKTNLTLKHTYTNEMFIEKAIKHHGDKYNYSKVICTKAKQKVIIICKIHGEFQQTPDNHCQGKGCKLCSTTSNSLNQTYTNEIFIEKAIKKHGHKYDYSKTDYINSKQKVIIICRIHGNFIQTPQCHLSGAGCIKCSGTLQKTNNEFIQEVIEIYGNNIDCSNSSSYINRRSKIILHCTIHNIDFVKIPHLLLSGGGCPECSGNYYKLTTDIFIKKAIKIHGNTYNYSKVNYECAIENIIINCKEHGEFLQTPNRHLSGAGCQKCSNVYKPTTDEFIQKAVEVHGNRYDYSKTEYLNAKTKVIIICKEHGQFLQLPASHNLGMGCRKCSTYSRSLNDRFTNEIFIQKAIEKHEDKYDYSNVHYNGSIKKVIIICKEHGEFEQTPSGHLSGAGCTSCSIAIRSTKRTHTTNIFIQKAIEKHGNKYDYSKVNYECANEKVIIICKKHGEFEQLAISHIIGRGCIKCGRESNVIKRSLTNEMFIEKAIKHHGDKYDYSKVEYLHNLANIIIICKKHGEFQQIPNNHMRGAGCPLCGHNITIFSSNEFIQKAKEIHGNRYEYSKSIYTKMSDKVIITCQTHGDFQQTPSNHIARVQGCSKCTNKRYSKCQIKWLDFISSYNQIQIKHAENEGEYIIPGTKYSADGYCQETNTIYEFHGDFWHGNPTKFNKNNMNTITNKTYGELYEKTIKREQEIKNMGFNLVVMWESDWNKINNSIRTLQNIFRLFK